MLDEVDEALTAPILGNSEDEVEAMKHTLAGVVDKFNSLAPKVDEIKAIAKTVTAHGRGIQRRSVGVEIHTYTEA